MIVYPDILTIAFDIHTFIDSMVILITFTFAYNISCKGFAVLHTYK